MCTYFDIGETSALFSLAENDIIIIEIIDKIQLMTVYGNQEITVNVTKGRRIVTTIAI